MTRWAAFDYRPNKLLGAIADHQARYLRCISGKLRRRVVGVARTRVRTRKRAGGGVGSRSTGQETGLNIGEDGGIDACLHLLRLVSGNETLYF